jgi:hypothetical protein
VQRCAVGQLFSSTNAFNRTLANPRASQSTSSDISKGHTFTPQEASKLLPDIRIKIRGLIEHRRFISQLRTELEKYSLLGYTSNEMAEKAARLDALVDEGKEKIDEVEDLGVVVRDLEWGVVDFPAERFGRKVMLCWRYGEPEVSFWHEFEESYPDRKLLKAQLIQP